MNYTAPRQRPAALRPLAATLAAALFALPLFAAKSRHIKSLARHQATLSFTMMARLGASKSAAGASASSGSVYTSRVWSKGNKLRIETSLGDRPIVLLVAPPYVTRFVPATKAGVRWKADRLYSGVSLAPGFDLQTLLSRPEKIRTLLKAEGATLLATTLMDGAAVDVYSMHKVTGKGDAMRVMTARGYLRRSDALPVRLEIDTGSVTAYLSWHSYKRGLPVPDTMFAVPRGTAIRDEAGKPSLFGM